MTMARHKALANTLPRGQLFHVPGNHMSAVVKPELGRAIRIFSGGFLNGESQTERGFWRCWLAGLMLFAVMIALNPSISNSVAPMGISDHRRRQRLRGSMPSSRHGGQMAYCGWRG